MTYLEKKGCELFCKMYEKYQVGFVKAMQEIVNGQEEEEEKQKQKAAAEAKKDSPQYLRLVK